MNIIKKYLYYVIFGMLFGVIRSLWLVVIDICFLYHVESLCYTIIVFTAIYIVIILKKGPCSNIVLPIIIFDINSLALSYISWAIIPYKLSPQANEYAIAIFFFLSFRFHRYGLMLAFITLILLKIYTYFHNSFSSHIAKKKLP